ncbi:MAG: trypsin-like peptidase domain-containing protein [Myxococcales bacterium]
MAIDARRRSSKRNWFSAVALSGIAAGALLVGASRSRATAPVPSLPSVPAAVASARPARPVATEPALLTTEQIAERALPSVVGIRCGDQAGAGFFVADDLVVTNAHVTCPGKEIVSVSLHDGREILGKVKSRDPWIDFATIEVAGSNVPALRTGDPLSLKPGARIAVVGSPKGLDFSVNEGSASYVGRSLHGIGYIQFSAAVNPGNSGGPLLDATGAAVGIVSLKRMDAEGIAFALPLSYALPPQDAAANERWNAFLAAVRDEDARERTKMLARLERPALLGLRSGSDGEVGALLAQMRTETPLPGRIELSITQGTEGCVARGVVSKWLPLDEIVRSAGNPPKDAEWLLRSGDAKNLYYTVATVDFTGCRLRDSRARVSLDGGEALEISGREINEAMRSSRRAQERHEAEVALADAANEVRADQWRSAFRNARARVDAAGAMLTDVRGRAAGSPDASQWEGRIAAAEALLRSAESDLAALDRRASNSAVPREWRR